MSKEVIFNGKQRQGPTAALTVGKKYTVIRENGDMIFINNDRGVNRWYYGPDFSDASEPVPVPLPAREVAMAFANYLEDHSIRKSPLGTDWWMGYNKAGGTLESHFDDFITEYQKA